MLALDFIQLLRDIGGLLRAACWFTTPSSEPGGGKTLGDSPDDDSISNPLSSTLCFTDSSSQSVSSSVLPLRTALPTSGHGPPRLRPSLEHFYRCHTWYLFTFPRSTVKKLLARNLYTCTVVVLENQSLWTNFYSTYLIRLLTALGLFFLQICRRLVLCFGLNSCWNT